MRKQLIYMNLKRDITYFNIRQIAELSIEIVVYYSFSRLIIYSCLFMKSKFSGRKNLIFNPLLCRHNIFTNSWELCSKLKKESHLNRTKNTTKHVVLRCTKLSLLKTLCHIHCCLSITSKFWVTKENSANLKTLNKKYQITTSEWINLHYGVGMQAIGEVFFFFFREVNKQHI